MARKLADAQTLDDRLTRLRAEVEQAIGLLESGRDPRSVAGRLRQVLDQVPPGRWDREACIDAGQRYEAEFGETPTAVGYNPALARAKGQPELADRWEQGDFPSYPTIRLYFKTWDAYMEACGFDVRPHLPPRAPGRGGDAWAHMPVWDGWRYLEGLRKRAGYSSQYQLAEATGLTHGYINSLENGRHANPTIRVILALAKACKVRPAALADHYGEDE